MFSSNEGKKNRLFLGGLSFASTVSDIRNYFSKFGEVRDVFIRPPKTTRTSRSKGGRKTTITHSGCGIVEMNSPEALQRVLSVQQHSLLGQPFDCRIAYSSGQRKLLDKTIGLDRRKIFIPEVPRSVTKEDLYAYFSKNEDIEEITLITKEGRNRAFAYIVFKRVNAGVDYDGRELLLQEGITLFCRLAMNPQQLNDLSKKGQSKFKSRVNYYYNPGQEHFASDNSQLFIYDNQVEYSQGGLSRHPSICPPSMSRGGRKPPSKLDLLLGFSTAVNSDHSHMNIRFNIHVDIGRRAALNTLAGKMPPSSWKDSQTSSFHNRSGQRGAVLGEEGKILSSQLGLVLDQPRFSEFSADVNSKAFLMQSKK